MYRLPDAKAFVKDVFINQERKLRDRRALDTLVVLTVNYADSGSRLFVMKDAAPYEKSKFLGSGGSTARKAET